MSQDASLFDKIRICPDRGADPSRDGPRCEWVGCEAPGCYPAPKGRLREGEYHSFCLDHVRLYNKSYNYFAGMSDAAVAAYQRDAAIGHRPTWKVGVNGSATQHPGAAAGAGIRLDDPLFVLRNGRFRREAPSTEPERRLKPLEREAFQTLGLPETADRAAIKSRFKELVKKHHPDANGGDRSSEERLRRVIQAHNSLKAGGFC